MKKLLSVLTLHCILASTFFALLPARSAAVTHGYLKYDANDDGRIDMKDVLAVRKFMASIITKRDIDFLAADGNEDTMVNARDLLMIRKVILNIEPSEGNNTDGRFNVDEIKIGGKNISRYTIVLPEPREGYELFEPATEYAASELRTYLYYACGLRLNVAKASDEVKTYKIKFVYDTDDEYDLGDEGFILEACEDGDFVITCGAKRGSLYGAYTFLEDLIGYRFLTADVDYLYENKTVDIPTGYRDRQVPGFEYRGITQAGVGDKFRNWGMLKVNALDGGARASRDTGGGLGTLYIHAHSLAYQLCAYDNYNDPSVENGGFYNKERGAYSEYANDFFNPYHQSQPCMTDDYTYEAVLYFNYTLLDERLSRGEAYGYNFTQISCATNDNTNYCMCARCKQVYYYEGSVAGTVIRLANRVAEKMAEDYPELDIYTIAYAGGNIPPLHTRPNENVCVCACTTGCNNHSLRNTEECEAAGGNPRMRAPTYFGGPAEKYSNKKDMEYLDAWLELTDNLYFWYYGANYNYFTSPAPNLFAYYDDIKYLYEKGIIGIYSEGSSEPTHYNFEYLRSYLNSKILWDPAMSEEEYEGLMDEYLMIYYGDGWRSIKQYILMSDHASDINGCWTNNHDAPWDVYNEEYFRDHYAEMAALFDEAYDQAQTAEQKARVEMCSVHCHFLGLSVTYERDYANGDAASRAKYAERYAWMWNYYNDNAYSDSNPNGIRGYVYNLGTAGFEKFPSSSGDIYCPMEWYFDQTPLFDGHAGTWTFNYNIR